MPLLFGKECLRYVNSRNCLIFRFKLTLNILDALVENLLEHLGVIQLRLNLGNDALGELLLLPLLDTLLVSNP